MKKIIAIYYFVCVFSIVLYGQSDSLLRPTGFVNDTVNILTQSEKNQIEALLKAHKDKTTNEIAVLIVPTLGQEDIKQYANRKFHEWGIGVKGKNNGILFLWSTGDRKIRFEVGYGLEPLLTDGRAGQIIRENITPLFRQSKWFEGLKSGLEAAIAQIEPKQLAENSAPVITKPTSSDNSTLVIALIIGFTLVVGLIAWILAIIREKHKEHEFEIERLKSEVISHRNTHYRETRRTQEYYTPVIVETEPSHSKPTYESSTDSSSFSSTPSESFSSSSSDFGGYSGGDSGGGGADGSY